MVNWSAAETMTGNQVTETCVHDQMSISTGCAPQLFGDEKTFERLLKKWRTTV
jgi:hypothetical protein